MKTPDLTAFFNPACAFSAQSLAAALQSVGPLTASIVITVLKEASIHDQGFEQAAGFRNAEKALVDVTTASKPARVRAEDEHAGPLERQWDKLRPKPSRRKAAKTA